MATYTFDSERPLIVPSNCPFCYSLIASGVCTLCGYRAPKPPEVVKEFKPGPPRLVAGLDLGQLQDYTALCLLEKNDTPDGARIDVRALKRFELGTSYTVICDKVKGWMSRPPWDKAPLVVDQTGVGVAVVNMFQEVSIPGGIIPLTITAGRSVSLQLGGGWHVAKVELVSALQALLSGRRLGVAQGIPEAENFLKELKEFKVKITKANNESFEAWREAAHDDLVLAVGIAAWYAERGMVARIMAL